LEIDTKKPSPSYEEQIGTVAFAPTVNATLVNKSQEITVRICQKEALNFKLVG
jgi:hypothetical protein